LLDALGSVGVREFCEAQKVKERVEKKKDGGINPPPQNQIEFTK
jgi:hypothetical protein